MEEINIAKILKDCPKGIKLYSPMCGECTYLHVSRKNNDDHLIIKVKTINGIELWFNEFGKYFADFPSDECLLFPSEDLRDWSIFQRPFKNGDIIYNMRQNKICIYGIGSYGNFIDAHCEYHEGDSPVEIFDFNIPIDLRDYRHASEKEKQKLLDSIKANGYEWDAETNTLKKTFKDGDILVTDLDSVFILKTDINDDLHYGCYAGFTFCSDFYAYRPAFAFKHACRLATEEEKLKLFEAIKYNGYKWNAESKTLETLITPKFKVGDKVILNSDTTKAVRTIFRAELDPKENYVYYTATKENVCTSGPWNENELSHIPNKFNTSTLKPFESKILVRAANTHRWMPAIFGFMVNISPRIVYCVGGTTYSMCIPYVGNEHLLGTTDDCDEYYKTW